jgi:signal transduction histidine kinase
MTGELTRILVVDDQDAARFVKVQILRRAGYVVSEASTGHHALELAAAERPDLVVLDVNLPDLSGLDVCRRLKEQGDSRNIQVLQVSQTAVTDADRVKGLDYGADAYLIEPLSPAVLLATIRALMRARRAEDQLALALEREQEARGEAERANRFKDEFLAMVSHELRTPLSAMTGWIWQLQRGGLDPATYRRAVDALDRNARLQIQLINDLLDLSRISAGKLDIDLEPIDVRPVVLAATESRLAHASHKRDLVHLQVHAEPATILGDAGRLQQVVANVVNNAYQFTPEGGTIVVSSNTEGDHVFIRVRDSGAGIEPALLPHVFERFRQGRGSPAGREQGLGLGLSIVKYLVERMHGAVRLDSEGAGRGTTCTIQLPLLTGETVSKTTAMQAPTNSLDGLRLLLVEDDGDSREALEAILVSYGASVVAVEDALSAEESAVRNTFDVLVTDIGLPDASGGDLLERLRRRGNLVPAVAVTAFATLDERHQMLAQGFNAHIAKPVDPDRLVRTVARAASAARESDDR